MTQTEGDQCADAVGSEIYKETNIAAELMLARLLLDVEIYDAIPNYALRARAIWQAMALAAIRGYDVGVNIDPEEPDWPVVFIELPVGQVSWHMDRHAHPRDGHTTPEKYQRVRAYAASLLAKGEVPHG